MKRCRWNLQCVGGWITISISLFLLLASAPTGMAAEEDAADQRKETSLSVGRSTLITTQAAVTRVSVADPAIADVQVVTPTQIVVLGKKLGITDVVLWAQDGTAEHHRVEVIIDANQVTRDLSRFFPTATLQAVQTNDVLAVTGTLRRAEDTQRLKDYMEIAGLTYVDLTSLAGVQQVLIKVRVAEASRQALRSLGVNGLYGGDDFIGGSTIGGNGSGLNVGFPEGAGAGGNLPFQFVEDSSIGSAVTLFAGFPEEDLLFFLEALEDNKFVRIMAEPSLIALSGEEASFLAGGEFPIPVVQGTGGGGGVGTSITIEFKEFGVRLRFRPTVLGDGRIRMKVAPEVSNISDVGAVQIEGFSIPSIATRRAETTLEMNSGQTFALAGLIDQETRANTQVVPGLDGIPVLGSLFRSVRYQTRDTELVVLATVELVEPINMTEVRPLPGDLHDAPNDWELYAQGYIEGRQPTATDAHYTQWLREKGLDKLRGPGAWESMIESTPPAGTDSAEPAPAEGAS